MGLDRYSDSGDSTAGFWLFQNVVSLNPDGTFNGQHTDGDILIITDFKKGGGEAAFHVYQWAGGGLSGPLALPDDTAYAISNTATIPTAWPFTPKSGPANQYQPGMFLEVGLNLNALFEEVPCYTSFMAETRSSDSLTATLSDFVMGSISICDPHLSISKTADQATINAGDTASYTITVENTGEGPAQGVVITDLLPAGVVWTASAGTITNGTLTYVVGTIDPGETITIQVSGATTALNCGVLTDTATVTSINNEPNALSATATITVYCPSLAITKTADQPVIDAGETAAFTITVSNAGPGDAYGVTITDTLPAGVPWTTSTPGAVIVGNVLTYNVGTLAAGATTVINVSGVTTAANSGTLFDLATVTSTNSNPPSLNASATVTVLSPGLAMVKSADQPFINAGDVAAFTILVRNTGPGDAFGVVVTDTLPAGVPWTTSTPGAVIVGNVLTYNIGTLAAGATSVINVSGLTTAANCGLLTDTALLTTTNNGSLTSTATVVVNCPSLAIDKVAASPTINAGDTARFTINVNNTGSGDAYDVVITDTLPAGVVWTTTTEGASIVGNVLTYNVGTLLAGATAVVQISGATTAANCGVLSDTATVTSSNNAQPSLSDTATVTVYCPALAIVKTADQPVINAGDTVTFTITVTNTGLGDAYGVVITDPLAAGLVWTTSTAGAVISGNSLTYTVGTLAPGASAVVQVSGQTTFLNCGLLSDTAGATSTNNDPSYLVGTAEVTIQCPNLAITKTAAQEVINAGDVAAFTITVSNAGPGAAYGVLITDILPAGVVWTTSTPGVSIVNNVLTYTVGTLAAGTSVVMNVSGVTTAANCGALTDTATVSSTNNAVPVLDATATVTVNCAALSVVKTADQEVIQAGETMAFTITISNSGPGDAYGVLVKDTLPAGMQWTSSTPGVVIVNGILTYNVGTLAAGETVVLHISAATTMTMSGMVGNAVFVTTSNGSGDPLIATAIVTVENCPPVSVTGLVREGVHHQPTRIVISFNGALDPVTASDPANYQLSMVAPFRRGVLIPLTIKEVVYDPVTRTVTLFPTRLLNVHYRYQLVISGVEDICGNPIVGNSPDGSYVTTFGREALRIGIAPPHGSIVPRPTTFPISGAHQALLERVAAGNGPNSGRAQMILSQAAMNWHPRQLVPLSN